MYVRALGEPDGIWQVSVNGGSCARWRPDGRELFYLSPGGALMAAPIVVRDDRSIEVGEIEELFEAKIVRGWSGGGQSHQYDVSRDGERFLINTVVEVPSAPLTLLLNWQRPNTAP